MACRRHSSAYSHIPAHRWRSGTSGSNRPDLGGPGSQESGVGRPSQFSAGLSAIVTGFDVAPPIFTTTLIASPLGAGHGTFPFALFKPHQACRTPREVTRASTPP